MASAKKLPSGNWRVNLYVGKDAKGKRQYKSFTHPNKKTAEFMAAEFSAKKNGKSINGPITLGDAIDLYIDSKSNILSPSTIREYKRSRKTDLSEIMDMKIDNLTQQIIQEEINREAKSHSPKSIKNMHGLLSSVLGIYRPEFKLRTTLPQKKKTDIYVPSEDELVTLINAVQGTEIEKAILLAAFGSMRRSEIAALTDKDIKNNSITVDKAMIMNDLREWVISTPKTYTSYRTIEYPDFVIERFNDIKGRLISLNPNQITKHFSRALKESGIKHFRFHDLRHYQASILHAMGVPDKYIMERGGWKSKTTLDKVYKHTMDKKKQEVTEQINKHFSDLMQHEMQHDKI